MLLTILARMPNDEQRLQLLKTLRNRLTNYNLNWFDIRNIINLFSKKDQIRFEVLKFFLLYINNLIEKINVDDYIYLSNQCADNNEQLKFDLFEQIYEKLNIRNKYDFEHIIDLFQIEKIRQKVESILRNNQLDLCLDMHEGI